MEISGTRTIQEQQSRLWEVLLNPDFLEATVPGAKTISRDGDDYSATLERGLAGMSVELSTDVTLVEWAEPDYVACEIEGTDNTINSRVDGTTEFELTDVEEGTELQYSAEFDFSGKLASLGSRLIKRQVKNDLDTFFSNIETELEEETGPDVAK